MELGLKGGILGALDNRPSELEFEICIGNVLVSKACIGQLLKY